MRPGDELDAAVIAGQELKESHLDRWQVDEAVDPQAAAAKQLDIFDCRAHQHNAGGKRDKDAIDAIAQKSARRPAAEHGDGGPAGDQEEAWRHDNAQCFIEC